MLVNTEPRKLVAQKHTVHLLRENLTCDKSVEHVACHMLKSAVTAPNKAKAKSLFNPKKNNQSNSPLALTAFKMISIKLILSAIIAFSFSFLFPFIFQQTIMLKN